MNIKEEKLEKQRRKIEKRAQSSGEKKKLEKLKNYAEARKREKETLEKLKENLDLKKLFHPNIKVELEQKKEPEILNKIEKKVKSGRRFLDTEEKKDLWKKYQKAKKERKKAEEKIPGKVPQIYEKERKGEEIIPQAAMLGEEKVQNIYGHKDGKIGLENIEGKTLKDAAKDKELKEKLRENKEEIADQMAEILSEMTKRGVSHNDLTLNNLIVQKKEGKPKIKIIDFGMAQKTSDKDHSKNNLINDLRDASRQISTALDIHEKKFKEKLMEKYERKIEEKM